MKFEHRNPRIETSSKFEIRNRRLLAALAVFGLVAHPAVCFADGSWDVDPEVLQAEQARVAAVNKAMPTVLAIFSPGGQGGGSGVVISPDGYALTNFHVARPCGTFMKCGMADGKLYDAVIVGLDPVGDVGLVKLFSHEDFPAAELADSDQVQVGDWCFAMGNPFLLATDFHPTVSYGVVSGVHRYQYPAGTLLEYADCIQVDAAINPGNSGGPLFDSEGRLVGINGRGSFEKRGRVNVGVGYSISINQIKNFLGHLKAGLITDHATLGAVAATSEDGRVLVSDILEHSDAYRRGLRYDDEIISVGGRTIRSVNALKNVLGIFPKGWRVAVSYRRGNKTYDTFVRLMGVHTEAELLAKIEANRELEPPAPNPRQPGRRGGQPQPGGRPQPGGEPKPGEPKLPNPSSDVEEALHTPIPEELKKQFEERTGYANYYFNRQSMERIWKNLASRGEFSSLAGPWTIEGRQLGTGATAGGPIAIHLADGECDIELPTGDSKITVARGLDAELNPPGSGGLLAAMYLWRRMLIGGPGKYGQVTSEGTIPLPGHDGLFDVLSAIGGPGGVEALFYCAPADGELVCIEMYPDESSDPCEVYFSDYQEAGGRFLPRRMEVRYGNKVFGVFVLTDFDLQKTAEKGL
jgi:S1-C subfamily serine protease